MNRAAPSVIVTRTARFRIDPAPERDVIDSIVSRTAPLSEGSHHLVVTPNMNHLALLQSSQTLGRAYRRAHMHLADGWPVVRLARLLGTPLEGRTTGSGIVAGLAKVDAQSRRMYVIGGSTRESNRRAAQRLSDVGWNVRANEASEEWLADPDNLDILATELREHDPHVVLIGIGSPKQEDLAMRLMDATAVPAVFIGVGAGIDFLAGEVQRAPHWMRALHLEFLHRILVEPRRMLKRYVGDVPHYAMVVWQSLRSTKRVETDPGPVGPSGVRAERGAVESW